MYPGIVAQAVLTTSRFSGASVVSDRESGFLREILVASLPRSGIVLGKAELAPSRCSRCSCSSSSHRSSACRLTSQRSRYWHRWSSSCRPRPDGVVEHEIGERGAYAGVGLRISGSGVRIPSGASLLTLRSRISRRSCDPPQDVIRWAMHAGVASQKSNAGESEARGTLLTRDGVPPTRSVGCGRHRFLLTRLIGESSSHPTGLTGAQRSFRILTSTQVVRLGRGLHVNGLVGDKAVLGGATCPMVSIHCCGRSSRAKVQGLGGTPPDRGECW